MVDITIPRDYELDWDDLAIDDGTVTLQAPTYGYHLQNFDGTEEIAGNIDSIRYSPEVNSAPSITIDIPPRETIDGVTYLGGELTVYVDGEFLFDGDVVVIDTAEKEGESYSIKARSKGKQIDGEIVDERPQNVILQDFMAKIIDKFNEYDAEAVDIANTADEDLTNIVEVSDIIRRPDGTSGTVRYNNVGDDASEIDIIYVKATVGDSLDISIESASSVLYNQTVTELEFGQYGTWFPVFPDISSTDSYDIEFELNGSGTILYDWISLTEDKVKREVLPFDTEIVDQNLVVQNATTNAEFSEVFEI